ncbi:hypothetical protein Pst134EA_032015 [Puccinia striiformis f. sp. tritici]|uniref:uncharacterized protein n=1 Tax=Puccinia striiformis f. sp. tritici TaxID=168172 RepID=UPI00200860E7|nr:uncharacterized protein Pst134EA_032015 [Puccinia striiformis f. sp. tritici]KAH9444378.1 hypothetical protein Pst134EA_032015 [Puccinia striiformis f. sp. tritici]
MVVISVWAVMTICVLALLLPATTNQAKLEQSIIDLMTRMTNHHLADDDASRTHRYISTEPRTVISRPKLRNKYLNWNMGQQVDAPFGPTFG